MEYVFWACIIAVGCWAAFRTASKNTEGLLGVAKIVGKFWR